MPTFPPVPATAMTCVSSYHLPSRGAEHRNGMMHFNVDLRLVSAPGSTVAVLSSLVSPAGLRTERFAVLRRFGESHTLSAGACLDPANTKGLQPGCARPLPTFPPLPPNADWLPPGRARPLPTFSVVSAHAERLQLGRASPLLTFPPVPDTANNYRRGVHVPKPPSIQSRVTQNGYSRDMRIPCPPSLSSRLLQNIYSRGVRVGCPPFLLS